MKYLVVLIAAAVYALPLDAHAATLRMISLPERVGVGDTFEVSILVDAPISLNAFSGTLDYPAELLEPISIRDGGSLISLWITRPTTEMPISFAGLAPGGYAGSAGLLFKAQFKVRKPGDARISLSDVSLLRNDGSASRESYEIQPIFISLESESRGDVIEENDPYPPEPFDVYVTRITPEGPAVLVFSAVDKHSGIDRYEVRESRFLQPSAWRPARSPYVIHDQYLTSDLHVKALDKEGNERVIVYPRPRLVRLYEAILIGILIMLFYKYGTALVKRRNESM